MSAAEEVQAILWIANLFSSPNAHLSRMRGSSEVSTEAKALLDDIQDTDDNLFDETDFFPFYDLNRAATSIDNHLASRIEEELSVELPKDKESPVRAVFKTRSLLSLPIILALAFILQGCTTRPRVTSGGDTHYTSTTTITVSALEGAGSLPPAVGQAMRLARTEQKEMRWPEQD